MLRLRDLQRGFLRAVSGEDASDGVIAEIEGRGPLGADERVAIYARMYGARLVDALAEDYPRVMAVLGWEKFHAIAHAYVAEHPSRHPSLRWFGERFPGFLAGIAETTEPGFLADLARLEWARVMAFDAADVALMTVAELRRRPPERWADLRLRAVPALVVMHAEWPVHEIWQAPGNDESDWRSAACWLRVWRQGDAVFQAPLDGVERLALAHVQAGADFGALCTGLATLMPPEEAAGAAGALVLRWIEDELLCADDAGS